MCCQAAQTVLISLFELNTPEFTMLLGALPKTFQDGATKLLHSHLKNSSISTAAVHYDHPHTHLKHDQLISNITDFFVKSQASPNSAMGRPPSKHPVTRASPLTSPTSCSHGAHSPRYITQRKSTRRTINRSVT